MLSLYCDELIGNIEEHKGKKYLMVDDYMLDKVFGKIEGIFDDTNILIDTDDKLSDDITLKMIRSFVYKYF